MSYLSPSSFFYHLAGGVFTSSGAAGRNSRATAGAEVEMEVNLQSLDPSQRTLHWFVNGEQQKVFIKGVSDRGVRFVVCYSSLLISLIHLLALFLSDNQWTLR